MTTREHASLELVASKPTPEAVVNLGSLAACFGLDVQHTDVESFVGRLAEPRQIRLLGAARSAIAIDVASVARSPDHVVDSIVAALRVWPQHKLFLLTAADARCQEVLARLTDRAVGRAVVHDGSTAIRFPTKPTATDIPLQAFSFERARAASIALAVDNDSVETLMAIDDDPSFVRLRGPVSPSFVWATPQVIDAGRSISVESEFELALDQYLPAITFFRQAFGEACWHSPVLAAGLIIDDPLLVRKYGLVDFTGLLKSARSVGYRVTLAFIPWNHWRVGRRQASLFSAQKDVFSVCIHGCDHTHHEFGGADEDDLFSRSLTAVERMKRLCSAHQLPLEPVMVFPQEKYSHEAVRAVARTGAFAAIANTRLIPTSGTGPAMTVSDLLTPAQDRLHGMPIFKRHYFTSMRDLALSLYLGRPAIMACHHTDFRDGAAKAESFASELIRLGSSIRWLPLAEMVSQVHWRRWAAPNRLEIRFFGETVVFDSGIEEACTVRLSRRVPENRAVQAVAFDGAAVAFEHSGEFVVAEVSGCAPGVHNLRLALAPPAVQVRVGRSFNYQLAVAVRRFLSELRDRVVTAVSNVHKVTHR